MSPPRYIIGKILCWVLLALLLACEPLEEESTSKPNKPQPKPRSERCKGIPYTEEPQTKAELKALIQAAINKDSPTASLNYIDTSAISDMSKLFANSTFNGDISCWDTFNVTDMSSMFKGATAFNQNIGPWDTANVSNMQAMFSGATAFNQDISKWRTASVTNMAGMFSGPLPLNKILGVGTPLKFAVVQVCLKILL